MLVHGMLIFPLASITMCCGDNLVDWHFQYCIVSSVCMNFCVIQYMKIYYMRVRGVLIFHLERLD